MKFKQISPNSNMMHNTATEQILNHDFCAEQVFTQLTGAHSASQILNVIEALENREPCSRSRPMMGTVSNIVFSFDEGAVDIDEDGYISLLGHAFSNGNRMQFSQIEIQMTDALVQQVGNELMQEYQQKRRSSGFIVEFKDFLLAQSRADKFALLLS